MNATFRTLDDYVFAPPLPAILSVLIVVGTASTGAWLARRLRGESSDQLDTAAGFVLVAAVLAATGHACAFASGPWAYALRGVGWTFAAVGARFVAVLALRTRSRGLSGRAPLRG